MPSTSRLILRFALLTALVAAGLFAFRWHSAAAQLRVLEGLLGAGAEVVARDMSRHFDDAPADARVSLLDQARRDDARLIAVQLVQTGGRVEAASPAAAAQDALPAIDVTAGLRSAGQGGVLSPPARYVFDRALPGERVLRLVYDAQPLANAWHAMVWPALALLAGMAVVVMLLFRWLLVPPLASLRELADFAAALPQSGGRRLAARDSHLAEIDQVRCALNDAAAALESRRHELADQRALLRAVIDGMPGGVALKTLDGTLLLVNRYTAGRLGRSPQELEGRSVEAVGRPDYTAHMRALDARLVAHRDTETVVTDSQAELLLDGVTPHLVTKTLVNLPGRADPLVLTISTNVSDLRRTQRAVEDAQALLRAVFDADDAQLMLKDGDGRFVMVNAGLLKYWGFDESQVLGRRSVEIFGDLPGVRASLEYDRRVWAGEGPLVSEQRISGVGGEADFTITRRLVTAPDGRTLLLAVARDVSAMRRQARALQHQERLIREVIDLEDHFILVKDAQLRYVLVNAAYLKATGKRMDELVGRTRASAFRGNSDMDHIDALDRRVLDEGATIVLEETIDLRQGAGPRLFRADRRPIVLADGSTGVLTVIRDVTEERQHEASLRRAMEDAQAAVEARSRFLANISHELRTPINGMMGLTDLALASPLSRQQKEWLTLARASAHGLLDIVNDVLDLSKIDAGAMAVESTAYDLHALLVDGCRPMALRARAKGLAFSLAIDAALPEAVVGDAVRLRQVLANLLGNAVKFTHSGAVSVHAGVTDEPDPRCVIEVEDTGPGIAADKHEHVFQPFAQADESTTRRFGGTGLGLAICRQLVQLMDGTITLDSAPGRGSCFRVELPLVAAPRPPMAPLAGRRLVWIEAPAGSGLAQWQPWLARWQVDALAARDPVDALGQRAEAVDTLVLDGVSDPAAYDAAVREWRGRGELRRLLVVHAVGSPEDALEAPGSLLPAARGLAVVRLARPFTPRELHDALSQRLDARRSRAADGAARVAGTPLDGQRVLLAEDNEVNLLLAKTMLRQFGADVVSVNDGRQALERLLAERFDIVLMDIQMPELDGTEVVRQWRAAEATRGGSRTPILALTAHAMSGDRERFIEAGFDGYVGKPFSARILADEIARALGLPQAAEEG